MQLFLLGGGEMSYVCVHPTTGSLFLYLDAPDREPRDVPRGRLSSDSALIQTSLTFGALLRRKFPLPGAGSPQTVK